jgi:hypothetical protein
MTYTLYEQFAGFGGSSQGGAAVPRGVELMLAANHNQLDLLTVLPPVSSAVAERTGRKVTGPSHPFHSRKAAEGIVNRCLVERRRMRNLRSV